MKSNYQVAIIGGGLAGLSLAILLAKKNIAVVVFEQHQYPFHKVCGEYISLESWNFIESLGLDLTSLNLPIINNVKVTDSRKNEVQQKLDLGGFGISRYLLDNELVKIARKQGVDVFDNCKVFNVIDNKENHFVKTALGNVTTTVVCGSYGKLKPGFYKNIQEDNGKYIGVKYHLNYEMKNDEIQLHNFKGGYCGISKIENNKACLCYIVSQKEFKKNNNTITELEKNVLMKNIFLKKIFHEAQFIFEKPKIISQIYFGQKPDSNQKHLFIGDAKGTIAPLCGNGMSMALHSSKLLAELLVDFFENKIDFFVMKENYERLWSINFKKRIRIGKIVQHLVGNKTRTNFLLKMFHYFPNFFKFIIKQTHGKTF